MSHRNRPLFEKIASQIEEHPWLYDQESWGIQIEEGGNCHTAYCVAGWALTLSGYTYDPASDSFYSESMTPVFDERRCAAHLLGLSEDESLRLFDADWMFLRSDEVPDRLREIANGSPIV